MLYLATVNATTGPSMPPWNFASSEDLTRSYMVRKTMAQNWAAQRRFWYMIQILDPSNFQLPCVQSRDPTSLEEAGLDHSPKPTFEFWRSLERDFCSSWSGILGCPGWLAKWLRVTSESADGFLLSVGTSALELRSEDISSYILFSSSYENGRTWKKIQPAGPLPLI